MPPSPTPAAAAGCIVRRRLGIFLLLNCLVAISLAIPLAAQEDPGPYVQANAVRERVGIYHWGGRHATGFESGLRDIAQLNATIARIAISPRMDIDYNRGPDCIPGFSLSTVLDDPDLQAALANPRIQVVMITVYDGTTFGDCTTHRYLNPGFYTQENTAKLVHEYSEFVYRLHVLFQGTGKRFILSNWEGDNSIYCGQAWAYTLSQEFRDQCHAIYPIAYGGSFGPDDAVEGMVLWLTTRYVAAGLGRERARNEGLTGVDVEVAAELCTVDLLRDLGFRSVLFDVIPRVPFDYLSYSSWESVNKPDPATAVHADLDKIRALTGTDRIIIGEAGYSRYGRGDQQIELTHAVVQAAIAWGVPYLIQWNLYDQDPFNDYGLYDLEGNITALGLYFQWIFGQESPALN